MLKPVRALLMAALACATESGGSWGASTVHLPDAHRVQRVMSEDEQRLAPRAAKDELQWPLGHVDASDFLAVGGIDKDLAIGHVDAAGGIGHYAFAAAFREDFEILERTFGSKGCGISPCLGCVAHVEPRARLGDREAIGIE